MIKYNHITLILSFIVVCWGAIAEATIITVPTDMATIQSAIDSASPGDTVMLLDGVYKGDGNRDLNFHGKSMLVTSQNGPRNTIIDCEGSDSSQHRGFIFETNETWSARVFGLTIRNGYINHVGGAIRINRAAPTIYNCIFLNNYASAMGGTIHYLYGGGRIINCIFMGNVSGDGNTLSAYAASPRFENCTIIGNGLGTLELTSENNANPLLKNSILINGSIYAWNGEPFYMIEPGNFTIEDNIFFNAGAGAGSGATIYGTAVELDPLFCDTSEYLYLLDPSSPCLPENNQFGVLIGASDSVCVPTDINDMEQEALPDDFSLAQNYPNPFNPTTSIEFNVPYKTNVKIEVINLLGQTVRVLIDKRMDAGTHKIEWDGKDNKGQFVSSGIYLYRLKTDNMLVSKKMVLLK